MKYLLISLALIAFTAELQAQTVPSGMTYQGRLTDASNAPVPDGSGYEIEVRLWSASTGGTLLWGTRYTGVPLKGGAFNLILGSGGTPIPGATTTDLKIAFNTTAAHLGLTTTKSAIGTPIPSPSEILPRQQIFSTPYAFRAATVQPDGVLSAAIKDGEVKTEDLANNAVTMTAIADGAVSSSKLAPGAAAPNLGPSSVSPDRIAADYAVFWEEQPGNVFGGTSLTGWKQRVLNAGTTATPPGGSTIARNTNTITLQNGTYLIRASGPMYALGESQLVLRDVTGSPATPVVALRGTTDFSSLSVMTVSTIEGYLTVSNGPRQYELWQYFGSGDTNYPGRLGVAVNPSNSPTAPDKNIYSRIHIQKIQ